MTPADADEAFREIGAALAFLREKYCELRRLRPILDVSLETTERLRKELDEARAALATSERERRIDRALLDKRESVSAQLESMTLERNALRAKAERLEAAHLEETRRANEYRQEVERLKWEARGAPMAGEVGCDDVRRRLEAATVKGEEALARHLRDEPPAPE